MLWQTTVSRVPWPLWSSTERTARAIGRSGVCTAITTSTPGRVCSSGTGAGSVTAREPGVEVRVLRGHLVRGEPVADRGRHVGGVQVPGAVLDGGDSLRIRLRFLLVHQGAHPGGDVLPLASGRPDHHRPAGHERLSAGDAAGVPRG